MTRCGFRRREELARIKKAKEKSDQEIESLFSKIDSSKVTLEEDKAPEILPDEGGGQSNCRL